MTFDRLANLTALRSDARAKSAAFRAVETVGAEWTAARKIANAACDLVTAEERRITAEGFGGDLDLERAVLGHLARRHVDTCSPTWRDLHPAPVARS
jgi:phosphopantothenoylcysteine synthetase/decarboxylase